jgi:hypothetical protein
MSVEHDEVDRARRAQELLDNELLKGALDAIEREVFDMWANSPALGDMEKQALWQHIRACRNFRNMLLGYIETGKLAAATLKRFEDNPNMMQRIFKRAA